MSIGRTHRRTPPNDLFETIKAGTSASSLSTEASVALGWIGLSAALGVHLCYLCFADGSTYCNNCDPRCPFSPFLLPSVSLFLADQTGTEDLDAM